ncbi:MAG: helix-turn-helix domain-containing protein [Pseudomonadota bacterium]
MTSELRTPADVGAAIRARRRALGWDQSELARRIGASRLWVSQVEGGKAGAGIGLTLRAFAALDLHLTVTTAAGQEISTESPAPARSVDINAIVEAARRKPER